MATALFKNTRKLLLLKKQQLIDTRATLIKQNIETVALTEQELIDALVTINKTDENMLTLLKHDLVAMCFPTYREIVKSRLIPFLMFVLKQPYVPNGTAGDADPTFIGAHERKIMELLEKYCLTFVRNPNGLNQTPDFRIILTPTKFLDLELKSHATSGVPLFGNTPPKAGVVYIFCSGKYNKTTIFFGQDVLDKRYHGLYAGLKEEIKNHTRLFVEQNN